MRLITAALLGGIVLFFWGFVSHMVLPIGEMGHGQAVNEDVVMAALKDGLPAEEGVYHVPGLAPEKYEDAAATVTSKQRRSVVPWLRPTAAPPASTPSRPTVARPPCRI